MCLVRKVYFAKAQDVTQNTTKQLKIFTMAYLRLGTGLIKSSTKLKLNKIFILDVSIDIT